jgi:hypothetical protein
MNRFAIIAVILLLISLPALAGNTAQPIILGTLTTGAACGTGPQPCFRQFSTTNRLPISGGGGGGSVSVTAGSSNIVITPSPGTSTFTVDTSTTPTFLGVTTSGLTVNGPAAFTGGSVKMPIRVVTAAGAVTVSATTDYIVCINKTSGAATTVNLPGSPATGLVFIIKDCKGDDATNNITITPAAGTIDGASTYVMKTSTTGMFDDIGVVYNGTQWNLE